MRKLLVGIIFLTLITSCSKFRSIQRSDDWKVRYDAAMAYYEAKDYYRSSILMEELLPVIRGTKEAEKLMFYNCYTYFHQGMFILSADRFRQFSTIYSRSKYVEEAEYMHAYSLYMQSPEFSLDQGSTAESMFALQTFIEKYPTTDFSDQATAIMDDLQRKLEKKSYEIAKLYFKIREYKAALVAFDNFNKDFPDSDYNEEVDYLKIKAQYTIASESIRSKRKERLLETISFYEEYLEKYPKGKNIKKAEAIFVACRGKLEKQKI